MRRASVAFCLSAAIVTAAAAAHAQAADGVTGQTRPAISAGGSARWRFERYEHPGFGAGVEDRDGYFLPRYLVHLDVRPHDVVRVFGELQSSTVAGRTGGARRTDRNTVDLHQAFAELRVTFGEARAVTVRAGRQEVEFGSSRLVSTRDSLNVRQSFDGVRVMARARRWRASAFAIRPVEIDLAPSTMARSAPRRGASRPVTHQTRRRPGTSPPISPGFDRRLDATRRESPLSSGRRLASARGDRRALGLQPRTDAAVGQLWHRTDPRVGCRHRPRLHVAACAAHAPTRDQGRCDVGDRDPGAPSLETFSPLFSGVPYSGLAGLVGPSNVWDITPSLSVSPRRHLIVTGGAAFFSRTRTTDGIYGISGTLERAPGRSLSARIGTQATAQAFWSATPRLVATVTVTYFRAGAFLQETPPGNDVLYTTTFITCRF